MLPRLWEFSRQAVSNSSNKITKPGKHSFGDPCSSCMAPWFLLTFSVSQKFQWWKTNRPNILDAINTFCKVVQGYEIPHQTRLFQSLYSLISTCVWVAKPSHGLFLFLPLESLRRPLLCPEHLLVVIVNLSSFSKHNQALECCTKMLKTSCCTRLTAGRYVAMCSCWS